MFYSVILPIILIVLFVVILIPLSPFIFSAWGNMDFLFTKLAPNTAKGILAGDSFHGMVANRPGWHLNEPNTPFFDRKRRAWEMLENGEDQNGNQYPDNHFDRRPKWMRDWGLYWVGIPVQRRVDNYKFSWGEFRADGTRWLRTEYTHVLMVGYFVYAMLETECRTKDGLLVKVIYALTVRLSNPYIARFENADWLSSVGVLTGEMVKNFTGTFTFEQLFSLTDEEDEAKRAREDFGANLLKLNPLTIEKLGVELSQAAFRTVDFADDEMRKQHEASVTAVYTARQQGDAKVVTAEKAAAAQNLTTDAEARRISEVGTAEANAIKARITAQAENPELAIAAMAAEALKGAGANVNIVNLEGGALLDTVLKVIKKG